MAIIQVEGIGPVELPDEMSREEMAAALNKLPKPKLSPTAENKGNIITSDVPLLASQMPKQVPIEEPKTSMMDKLKALYEVPTAIAYGAVKEPLSMVYGLGRGAVEDAMQGKMPTAESRDAYYRQAKQFAPYQPTSPATPQALESIGGALQEARIPPYIGNIGMIPSAMKASGNVKPVMQESVMPVANRMAGALRNEGQMIQEAVQPVASKFAQTVEPATNRIAQALRSEPRIDIVGIGKNAPSAEDLATQSAALFKQAKESGVELNAKEFATNMAAATKELRNSGYDPRLYPKLGVAVEELTNAQIPKDFNELSTLRRFIQNAQKSTDPQEKMLATKLKDEFDTYVSTIPESSVVGGNKEGLTAWKQARDTYAKMSKSEVFTDMLEIAELEKTQFSASGAENSLSKQLRQLAKNDRKMRLFTKEEQDAIKQAAKGTKTQEILRLYGKFAPTSSVNSILPLLATSISGPVGLGLTAGAMGARYGATKMRKSDVKELAAMMRAGIQKEGQ
jgi:hypothetical protein